MMNVNDVVDYIVLRVNQDETNVLINLKLQKLLYYTQAWHLGINNRRLFNGNFQAWIHGPVNREIYDRFNNMGKSLYSEIYVNDVKNREIMGCIGQNDSDFINFILDNYVRFSPTELEQMTHEEEPWVKARGGLSPLERCENIIRDEWMVEYYGARYKHITAKKAESK